MKCEKCKKNTNLVIICPQDKNLILKCENCKHERKIERDKYNEVMFGVQKVYNDIIARWWVTGEIDPKDMSKHGRTGNACGALTSMGQALSETYAGDPKFYGATFCVGCNKHLPVAEFVWDGTNERVGS